MRTLEKELKRVLGNNSIIKIKSNLEVFFEKINKKNNRIKTNIFFIKKNKNNYSIVKDCFVSIHVDTNYNLKTLYIGGYYKDVPIIVQYINCNYKVSFKEGDFIILNKTEYMEIKKDIEITTTSSIYMEFI